MRRVTPFALFVLLAAAAVPSVQAGDLSAAKVLDSLKALEGTWKGEWAPGPDEPAEDPEGARRIVHEFRVTGGGSTVMETMFAGTKNEMINMFHLDGEDLVLTHYCAAGNQPTMKLDRSRSTAGKLVFEFTGGTNFDPKTDVHIHAAEISLLDADRIRSDWNGWQGGKSAGVTTLNLARSK